MAEFSDTIIALDNAGVELTIRQMRLLLTLNRAVGNGGTFKALADHLPWNKPSLTRTADVLEKAGWMKRYQTPEDRRGVRLQLTAKGLAEAAKIEAGYPKAARRKAEPAVAAE